MIEHPASAVTPRTLKWLALQRTPVKVQGRGVRRNAVLVGWRARDSRARVEFDGGARCSLPADQVTLQLDFPTSVG